MSTIIRVTEYLDHHGRPRAWLSSRFARPSMRPGVLIAPRAPSCEPCEGKLAQYLQERGTRQLPITRRQPKFIEASPPVTSAGAFCRARRDRRHGWGATTDMAGFAATWLRGITLINAPDDALAMAVGARRESPHPVGKAEPRRFVHSVTSVVADMDLLEKASRRPTAAGAYRKSPRGPIADPEILRIVGGDGTGRASAIEQLSRSSRRSPPARSPLLASCRPTSRSGGLREILNYGHWHTLSARTTTPGGTMLCRRMPLARTTPASSQGLLS